MSTKNIAIIVGAGKGKRMGIKDKALIEINRKPCIIHSVLAFEKSNLVDGIILVVQRNRINFVKDIVKRYRIKKVTRIVSGGKERQDSVYQALKDLDNKDYVLVHDAARPLVTTELIDRCIKAAKTYGSAIPAVLPRDTIKIVNKFVKQTLIRSQLAAIQTPQVFRCSVLKKAHESAQKQNYYGTDDSSLVERLGHKIKIRIVAGHPENIKITVLSDLIVVKTLLKIKQLS